jgi:hypothetical protein
MSVTRVTQGKAEAHESEPSLRAPNPRAGAAEAELVERARDALAVPFELSSPDDPHEMEAARAESGWFGAPGRRRGGKRGHRTASPLGDPGRPLAPALRVSFEGAFGTSLEHLRIHDSPAAADAARALDASAFTLGSHLVFGAGEFQPHTAAGAALLRHELCHALQAEGGAPPNVVWRRVVRSEQHIAPGGDRTLDIELTVPADYDAFERDVLAGMRRWVSRSLLAEPDDPPRSMREARNTDFREQLRAYYYQLLPLPGGPTATVTAHILVTANGAVQAAPETLGDDAERRGRYRALIGDWERFQSRFEPDTRCRTNCVFLASAVSRYLETGTVVRARCEPGAFVVAALRTRTDPRHDPTVTSGAALFARVQASTFPDHSHEIVAGYRGVMTDLTTGDAYDTQIGHAFVIARIDGQPYLIDAQTTARPLTTPEEFEAYWTDNGFGLARILQPGVLAVPLEPDYPARGEDERR